MTLIIEHRRNSLDDIGSVPKNNGVEIDLRGFNGEIVVSHDYGVTGILFDEWLHKFSARFFVANIKEMGIEDQVYEILSARNMLDSYFLLDLVTPSLVRAIEKGYVCAARVSEFECLTDAVSLGSEWLWVDSFSGDWVHLEQIVKSGIARKICIVSPELQGRRIEENFYEFEKLAELVQIGKIAAICTKYPKYWKSNTYE